MKTRMRILLSIVAVAAVGFVASSTLRAEAEPKAIVAQPLGLAAPGRVEPLGEERQLGARMPGLLVAVHVEENDRVETGQILAEIDRADLMAERQVAVATIELKQAERT